MCELCRKTVLKRANTEVDCKDPLFTWLAENEVFVKMSIFGDNDIVHISVHNRITVDAVHLIMADESRTNKLC